MKVDIPEPETRDDLVANKELYQQRVSQRDERRDGYMGSVLLPREGCSEFAVRAFHFAMTEEGWDGVEYAQEGLHQNGDYFDEFFDSIDEVQADIARYSMI